MANVLNNQFHSVFVAEDTDTMPNPENKTDLTCNNLSWNRETRSNKILDKIRQIKSKRSRQHSPTGTQKSS
jgi:hypothetical protein